MNTTELKALAEDLQINHEYCPKEVIQKASSAILELITNLEDAQGEIRALRATEAGLIERVKELEEGVRWYGEQSRLCRLVHSEGESGRNALSNDGGRKARALLEKKE